MNGKFLYVHGGQPEAMLRYGAFKQGLDLSDVDDIPFSGGSEMMDQWGNGEGTISMSRGISSAARARRKGSYCWIGR
ncbi:MAG: hypothetical protein CM1200mP39_04390 [Dehalococcoidia bacterium]|nr:MAG: hypothetical protein CM1200mP39_04390 [Dehalococcoidia bacterium]